MSKVEGLTKITGATGTQSPNFTNGFNVVGADSGISGFIHTENDTEPSSPSNGDTWWSETASEYKVYANGAWQTVIGSGSGGSSGWSITSIANTTYDSISSPTITQDTAPLSVQLSTDGTKMYIVGSANDYIYQYTLSTAYDVSTASYNNVSFNVSTQGNPREIIFSANGTKLFIIDSTSTQEVHQYSLSTAWDLSTTSYDNVKLAPSDDFTYTGATSFYTLAFSSDGTKMFAGLQSHILSYSLTTAYDLSTASYDSISFDPTTQDGLTISMSFNSDGTQLFTLGRSNHKIFQYTLSTAYDLSTLSYASLSYDVSNEVGQEYGITFSNDGTKMYIVDPLVDKVFQYSTDVGASGSGGSGGSTSSIAWGGDRGIRAGGNSLTNVIDYWDMTSAGNAQDFGDLLSTIQGLSGASNGSRAVFGGGVSGNSAPAHINNISYITTASTGNATDFGDLTSTSDEGDAGGDGTKAVYVIGRPTSGSATVVDTMDYITIANTGNAADFGNLTVARYFVGCASGSTRMTILGGTNSVGNYVNTIDYVTVATPGNATDFGDLILVTFTPSNTSRSGVAVCSDATRTVGAGGSTMNGIQYITTDTTGNATDFGDLLATSDDQAACSNGTVGHILGGSVNSGNRTNQIQTITIQTTGNATDFGDLTETVREVAATSGAAS